MCERSFAGDIEVRVCLLGKFNVEDSHFGLLVYARVKLDYTFVR